VNEHTLVYGIRIFPTGQKGDIVVVVDQRQGEIGTATLVM
jgi:hypothetical protein